MFDPQSPVSSLIAKEVFSVAPTTLLREAVELMDAKDINHLPVCEDERVIGMLSRFDLNRLQHSFTVFGTQESLSYNEKILDQLVARDVMTKGVKTIEPTTSIQAAAAVFKANDFHSLVVVGADGVSLHGILTVMDLVHYAYPA